MYRQDSSSDVKMGADRLFDDLVALDTLLKWMRYPLCRLKDQDKACNKQMLAVDLKNQFR